MVVTSLCSRLHTIALYANMTAHCWQTLLWSSKLSEDQSNVADAGKLLQGDNGGTENADLLRSVLSSRFERSWNVAVINVNNLTSKKWKEKVKDTAIIYIF